MKIVIASDSFKGTLSSFDICHLYKDELVQHPSIIAQYLPIADGGEGSLKAISNSVKGRHIIVKAKNPYFNEIDTQYFIDKDNNAYLETASCAGLCLIEKLNPRMTTTYGLGQQVFDALKRGCKRIYIFLGGSATNDGGCGLFTALGTKFFNTEGKVFVPTGGTLIDIARIDNSLTDNLLKDIEIIGMCDVDNPLYGLSGASYIYAPQKGADKKMIVDLDEGLKNLAQIVNRDLGKDIAKVKGSGAAGGLGGGILAFGHGQLESGIEAILNLIEFDMKIDDADYIISGEGKLDRQSLSGKAIKGIATRCQKFNKKLILIVGISEFTIEEAQEFFPCIVDIIETNECHIPFSKIKNQAPQMYTKAIQELLSKIKD